LPPPTTWHRKTARAGGRLNGGGSPDQQRTPFLGSLALTKSPQNTYKRPQNQQQVVQDAGYDEDYLVSNVKITLGVLA